MLYAESRMLISGRPATIKPANPGKDDPAREDEIAGIIGDIAEHVFQPADVAVLVLERDAELGQRLAGLAGALRCFRRAPGEALQRRLQGLLPDTRRLDGVAAPAGPQR